MIIRYQIPAAWKSVDLKSTMAAAHACTSGVSFHVCSKSHIIDAMITEQTRPTGYARDKDLFVKAMNALATVCADQDAAKMKAVATTITELKNQNTNQK